MSPQAIFHSYGAIGKTAHMKRMLDWKKYVEYRQLSAAQVESIEEHNNHTYASTSVLDVKSVVRLLPVTLQACRRSFLSQCHSHINSWCVVGANSQLAASQKLRHSQTAASS